MVRDVTASAEIGKTYLGKVVRLAEFGAFVELFPGTDGLLHISEISEQRIRDVRDELKLGDQVLVKAVLNLGQSLRIDVTAEGVESIEDLRMLRTFGCQMMQGYHLARPMPMTECLAFIADAEAQSLPPGTDGFQRAAG